MPAMHSREKTRVPWRMAPFIGGAAAHRIPDSSNVPGRLARTYRVLRPEDVTGAAAPPVKGHSPSLLCPNEFLFTSFTFRCEPLQQETY